MNSNKLQAYNSLRNILNGSLIVCGSTALQFYGLSNSDPNDLDLLLLTNDTESTPKRIQQDKEKLNLLSMTSGLRPYPEADPSLIGERFFLIFNYGEVKLNIHLFIIDKMLHSNLCKADFDNQKNILFASPAHIIKAKKILNRPKDIKTLSLIAKSIL
jgi:hypothetical protein